jgi:hypothetical protein
VLQPAIREDQPAVRHPDLGLRLNPFEKGGDGVVEHRGVAVHEQEPSTRGNAHCLVVCASEADVLDIAHQPDGGKALRHHLGAAVVRCVVNDDDLVGDRREVLLDRP